jgi:hypothetical protein
MCETSVTERMVQANKLTSADWGYWRASAIGREHVRWVLSHLDSARVIKRIHESRMRVLIVTFMRRKACGEVFHESYPVGVRYPDGSVVRFMDPSDK